MKIWKSFLPMVPELSVIEKQGDYIEGLWTDNLKEIKVLVKNNVCISFEMVSV